MLRPRCSFQLAIFPSDLETQRLLITVTVPTSTSAVPVGVINVVVLTAVPLDDRVTVSVPNKGITPGEFV
jgi:hypothetical protein